MRVMIAGGGSVDRYQGHGYVKDFSCWDQFLCLAFAQLAACDNLRDIENDRKHGKWTMAAIIGRKAAMA